MLRNYTSSEIVDIILTLGECYNNYRQAPVLYRNRFPYRRHPNHCMISIACIASTSTSKTTKTSYSHTRKEWSNSIGYLTVLGIIA